LFSQLLQLIDRNAVGKVVSRHQSDKHHKGINTWTHLVSMLFCHLANANSVREISNGLRSATGNLNHLGVWKAPSKSSVSYMNAHRSWEVFRDLYFSLYDQLSGSLARGRPYAARLKRKLFILDSSFVPLCLKIFDWAVFRRRKGAVKLHTVLDYDSTLPSFLHVTDGKTHDLAVARQLHFPSGSVVVMDRAYIDYPWLYKLDSTGVFFVTRLKQNTAFKVVGQSEVPDNQPHILGDNIICLTGPLTADKYPKTLRVVRVYDADNQREFEFLTNQMSWTADTVSQVYRARWEIEVFFKAIKQTLKIKTFVGTSPNAVLIQVWTAMIAILLLKYLKAKARYAWNLSNLAAFLRINLFVKINLWQWVNQPFHHANDPPTQLKLFSAGG
jgi:hypothetical protein